MQISSLSEEKQIALAIEASKITADLKAACTLEAIVSEDKAEGLWTIPTNSRGRQVVLRKKNPKTDNCFGCLSLE